MEETRQVLVCPTCGAEFDEPSRLKMHEAQEHAIDQEAHSAQGIDESLDEASAESFPSSDPPAETSPSS